MEWLLTTASLAILAAFVVPTVVQGTSVTESAKVERDLRAIRRSIEAFATGTGTLPRVLSRSGADVVASPSSSDSRGADSLATGYHAYVMDHLVRYDVASDAPEFDATLRRPDGSRFDGGHTLYAAVQLHGLTVTEAQELELSIDGGPTDALEGSNGSNGAGRFRYGTISGLFTAYYLVAPLAR